MERFSADAVVIGAGVVGLACARELARRGREVLILEAADTIMTQTSSRNSEVIHAGLYYPAGSLKAQSCVAGKAQLYEFLERYGVPFRMCGKLVVATNEREVAKLHDLRAQAHANGVPEAELLDGGAARDMEPELSNEVVAALWSPTTGLFDSHSFALSLLGEAESFGAVLALNAPVTGGAPAVGAVELVVGGDSEALVCANMVVNAAGHTALDIARRIEGAACFPDLAMHWCKGSYFSVAGRAPFQRLVYPTPSNASLGLHYTLDLGGRGRFGPDAEWLSDEAGPPFDYRVDPSRAASFYAAIRKYWRGLPDGALAPDYAGVRPKLVQAGEPAGDFHVLQRRPNDTTSLIHLIGIESPGLTASLALAAHVADLAPAKR